MKPGFLFYKVKVNLNAPVSDSFHYCKHQKLLIFHPVYQKSYINYSINTPVFSSCSI